MYVSLLLLLLLEVVDGQPSEGTNHTEYIFNGANSVEISCGQVPDTAIGIEWEIYNTAIDFATIFKFYHTIHGKPPSYRNGYTKAKYTISASVNTSLVVKDISLSDTGRFSCVSIGGDVDYQYCVMLQVLIPPIDASVVTLVYGDPTRNHSADSKGPYLENQSEEFTCYIRGILPGVASTAFSYYCNGSLRLNSWDDVGEVVENLYTGGTMLVEWKFNTSFNREDNGKSMKCIVYQKVGQYEKKNLGSATTRDVQVYFGATELEMTASPPGPVTEQTDGVFKCLSGEGNPQPKIKWSHGTGTRKAISGRYEAFKTESTLELRVDKTMNKEEVMCFIEADESTGQTRQENKVTLEVEFTASTIELVPVPHGDVEEGVTVEYVCDTASAYPGPPGVLWLVDDMSVRTGDGHTITNVQSSGDYNGQRTRSKLRLKVDRSMNQKLVKCLLENKDEQKAEHRLTVIFGATVLEITTLPPGPVTEQTDSVLMCVSGEGNPRPEIKWSHGTGTSKGISGRYEAFKTKSLLELRVNKTMNKKEVMCFIEADESTGQTRQENKVTLEVEFTATAIEMESVPSGDIMEDEIGEYVCDTDSAYPVPPGVLWSVDGDSVRTGDRHTITSDQSVGNYSGPKTRSTLRLKVDRHMNQKLVTCALENKDEQKAEHRLTVIFPPDGLYMDIGRAVKENTAKTVTCKANSANPVRLVTMEFFIDGANQRDITPQITLTDGTNGGQQRVFQFVFTSIRQQNGKAIKCCLLWNGTNTGKERDGHLDITYPPEVMVDGTAHPVVEYTARDIYCVTTGGNPSISGLYNYQWMYKPTYTESNIYRLFPPGSVILNGQTLQLKDLSYEKMAGTYKCIVTSIGGQNSGTSTLIVYYPAKFENKPEDVTFFAAFHTAVNLSIKFCMNPVTDYRIEWSIGETTVPEANLTNTVNGESVEVVYTITDVHSKSLGNHIVRVVNNAITGGRNDAIFLLILMLPGPPEKPMAVSWTVSLESITVTWKVGLNGGFEQFFIVRYREKGLQAYENSSEIRGFKTGEQGYYTITGLHPQREYDVLVLSVNGFGGRSETLSDVQAVSTQDVSGSDRNSLFVGLSTAVVVLAVILGVIFGFLVKRFRRSSVISKESSQTNEKEEPQSLTMTAVEGTQHYEAPTVETRGPASIYTQLQTTDYEEPNDL